MTESLAHGIDVIREWSHQLPAPGVSVTMRDKLLVDLIFESKKFLIYRASKIRDRQHLSVHRIRCLLVMLEEVCGF